MCGLIAILDRYQWNWSRKDAYQAIASGLAAMQYRGLPGRSSMQMVGDTILGHVRLPFINLDTSADQPMTVGEWTGVFAGEIFNYKELYPEAQSDTEVLLRTIADWKLEGFHDFDGFWSAVLTDGAERTVAVTDYLGQKPLYYHPGSTLVASELDAIVVALQNYRKLDLDPVYFSNVLKWGYDPTGRTPYADIRQLPPGTALRLDRNGGLREIKYWSWGLVQNPFSLREALVTSTDRRLIGDREVGMLLSGGLDSTILFKVLTELLGRKVKVFHAENGEGEFLSQALDGYPSQALVARPVTVQEALSAHQVPVDLGSMTAQLALAYALETEGFHAAISGDGADELFGGYRRAMEYDSQGSDVFCELPYYHLPRLDRLMMRRTVELRCPFLAPYVVKRAMRIPWEQRRSKEALKEAFADLVPSAILNRPKLPLKSQDVIQGGLEYRKQLVDMFIKEHNRD